ncbi:hypothetical protein DFQ01_10185 [Paenibacillus cellulosilyticus]|uniref:Glycosyl transferase family 2 n=1 Tax=Paenibacillus cellulosilyticus TaxID=375489 RepID=A0A2V2YZY4_9BACL|nr:hypothetical protein [Paenibacillus cellulosilyticus]PWW08364.1 hypothetical protein DFQ01_10185 [Paenibacillus cellulosilyticus]QKS47960.1 hypothetical protein HUB94_27070 [Paenibacillus cellulosilyticus]
MISLIALVLGSYVLAALSVHLIRYYGRSNHASRSRHYVLYARNEATRMEWFLRSINWFAHRSGTDVRVTVVDCGSSDETFAIVGHFAAKDGCTVESVTPEKHRVLRSSGLDRGTHFASAGEPTARANHAVFVDLNRPEDLAKLPLF